MRRPVMLVIKSAEGRRATADTPISPDEYERQMRKLIRGGLRVPRSSRFYEYARSRVGVEREANDSE